MALDRCGYIVVVSTLIYFRYMEKEIEAIYEFMNANFKYRCENGVENWNVERSCRISRIFTYYWLIQTYISGICNGAWPLVSTKERILPLPAIYPYDTKKSPYYELTIILQIVTNISAVTLLIPGNFPFPCICIHISAQFKILAYDAKNLVFSALLDVGVAVDDVIAYKTNCDEPNPKLDRLCRTEKFRKACDDRFVRIIKFHQTLLECCRLLEDFYSPFLVFRTITSLFFVIFTTFSLYNNDCEPLFSCVGLALYFCEALTEAFMYSVSGEMLVGAVDDFREAIFESKWYVCGKKIKRGLLLVQLMCRRGPKFTIGRVYTLNMLIFRKIVDSAVSYLVVLYKVTGKK